MIEIDPNNLELTKILIENEKLAIEKSKMKWYISATIIPLLAIIFTIFFGIYTQQQNEKNMFQIKAAEIIFNSKDDYEAKDKITILKQIFPDKLPKDFSKSFKPYPFDSYEVNSKKDLLKLLTADHNKNKEIILNWKKAFPGDLWVNDLIEK